MGRNRRVPERNWLSDCATRNERTEWNHRPLSFKHKSVILGTEATEWNSRAADEKDQSLARGRLEEAYDFAGHVEAIAQLHLDVRKTEALWLMTSTSTARTLDFDAKVVNPMKLKLLAGTLEAERSARN